MKKPKKIIKKKPPKDWDRWTPERIKELRSLYKESQPEFAPRVGVGASGLREWEQGRRPPSEMAELLLDRLEKEAPCKSTNER